MSAEKESRASPSRKRIASRARRNSTGLEARFCPLVASRSRRHAGIFRVSADIGASRASESFPNGVQLEQEMQTNQMIGIAMTLALALGCEAAYAGEEAGRADPCVQQSLTGLFVFSASGYNIVVGVAQPKAIVEPLRFHGDGTLSVEGVTRSINGVVAQIPAGGTGVYDIGPDCHGSLSFTQGPRFDFVLSPQRGEAWLIQTNPNTVFQGSMTKVSR